MFCVRYVCGDGRLLGLGVLDARAECLEERLPRLDDTDALRGVGGAAIMSGSLSAGQISSQCCIDCARLSDTGSCVFSSASTVSASDREDACNRCDVKFDEFDGFEGGGDVWRVSGLACCVLQRFEMRPGHRDCCGVSTWDIERFMNTNVLRRARGMLGFVSTPLRVATSGVVNVSTIITTGEISGVGRRSPD
jgi:hypothetical protein